MSNTEDSAFRQPLGREYATSVLTPEVLLARCGNRPQNRFAPGAVLLEEGRRSGMLYVLESGTVEISKEGETIDVVSDRGSVFGEMSILLNQPHMATVRVAREASCRVIDTPFEFMRAHPDVALHLAALLARRLNAVTNYLIDLRHQSHARSGEIGAADSLLRGILRAQAAAARSQVAFPAVDAQGGPISI